MKIFQKSCSTDYPDADYRTIVCNVNGRPETKLMPPLVDLKFTDETHEELETITINVKDYIDRTAIPIEWIEKYLAAMPREEYMGFRFKTSRQLGIEEMVEDWRHQYDNLNRTD